MDRRKIHDQRRVEALTKELIAPNAAYLTYVKTHARPLPLRAFGCTAGGEGKRCSSAVAVLAASNHQQETTRAACREEEDAGGPGAQCGESNPAGMYLEVAQRCTGCCCACRNFIVTLKGRQTTSSCSSCFSFEHGTWREKHIVSSCTTTV